VKKGGEIKRSNNWRKKKIRSRQTTLVNSQRIGSEYAKENLTGTHRKLGKGAMPFLPVKLKDTKRNR